MISDKALRKIIFSLVSFSAGALLAGALLHLLPESLESLDAKSVAILFIVGFIIFFIIERVLRWHHCHEPGHKCETHPFTSLILIGDGVHNFIDGLIIAAAFFVSPGFGILTTLLILSHEIPQELGDFGALVYGGMEKKRALFFNFLSQLACMIGGAIGWLLSGNNWFVPFLLPIAGGGFLYIAASDLIPELHKEADLKKTIFSFFFMVLGIAFVLLMAEA